MELLFRYSFAIFIVLAINHNHPHHHCVPLLSTGQESSSDPEWQQWWGRMGKAWRNINPSKPHQGLGAIPAPLAGFERSGDHDLTAACWGWEPLPAALQGLSLVPTHVSETRPRKSSSERGTAQPTSSQASTKVTHSHPRTEGPEQLWGGTAPAKSTSPALQHLWHQHHCASGQQVFYKTQNSPAEKCCWIQRAAGSHFPSIVKKWFYLHK